MALDLPEYPGRLPARPDGAVTAQQVLRRVESELAHQCGEQVLSSLDTGGGTVLVPAAHRWAADLNGLVTRLSRAGQINIRATIVRSQADTIPEAAHRAHELLDVVRRLGFGGVHRFEDLAVEYQLTRPGPARDHLETALDALDDHPDLLHTLCVHIGNKLQRKRTASDLRVHANTVDHRLKRIGQLIGRDPGEPDGQWRIRAALVARSYRTAMPVTDRSST
jgi:sugar diacid utilization regulator